MTKPNQSSHASQPLLTPAQAASLLEQVMFEQVFECVDLDSIYRLEQSLTMMVSELEGIREDQIAEATRAMLDRALLRLPDMIRNYITAAGWPIPGCELCEEEAREAQQQQRGKPRGQRTAGAEPAGPPGHPVRFHS